MAETATDPTSLKVVSQKNLHDEIIKFSTACHVVYFNVIQGSFDLSETTMNYMLNKGRQFAAILLVQADSKNDEVARLLVQTFTILYKLEDRYQALDKKNDSVASSPEKESGQEERGDALPPKCVSIERVASANSGYTGDDLSSAQETDDGESSDGKWSATRLINLVKETPFLYQKDHKLFHQRHMRDTRWEEIGAQVGLSGLQARTRWTSLRDGYKKRLNIMQIAKAQNKVVSVSRWAHFDVLHTMLHANYDTADVRADTRRRSAQVLEGLEAGKRQSDILETNPSEVNRYRDRTTQDRRQECLEALDLSIGGRDQIFEPGECEGELITPDLEKGTPLLNMSIQHANPNEETRVGDKLDKDHCDFPAVYFNSLKRDTAQKRSRSYAVAPPLKRQRLSFEQIAVELDSNLKNTIANPIENGHRLR